MSRTSRQRQNRKRRRPTRQATALKQAPAFLGLERLDPRMLMAGDIFATVLHDVNDNGIKDPEEPALENWAVFVDLNRNGALDADEPSGLTDVDGEVFITDLPEGSYAVRQVLQSGWFPSLGSAEELEVEVIDGEEAEILYLNTTTVSATIEGTVWNDLNADGIRDAEDVGLAGWTVFVDLNNNRSLDLDSNGDGTADDPEPSAVTNANGFYSITGLDAGQYKVIEVLQPGFEPTLGFDNKNEVEVGLGEVAVSDFGNFTATAGAIAGAVWNDFNGNGIREASDPGLSDWTVFLDGNDNGLLDVALGERSTVTDASGNYSFTNVQAGDYTVVEVLQAGWEPSPGFNDSVNVTVVAEGESIAEFANFTPEAGTISGTVYNDLNGNGSQGAGEPGLAGWTLFIDLDSSGLLEAGEPSAVTDANGDYKIFGAPFGNCVVREIVQTGFRPTAPGTGAQLVNLLNGEESTGVDFGNQQRTDSEIRGAVFVDSDHDSIRDAGERGLAGITVFIDLDNDDILDADEPRYITSDDLYYTPGVDESGTYEFTRLPAGTYHIREIVPDDQSATPEIEREHIVELEAGEVESSIDCGNVYRPNEIHGFKFDDLDADHFRDAGEPGIGGVTIYIDLDRDNVFDADEPSTVTGADGSYSFTNLLPGAYVVREIATAGSVQTFPTTVGGILWPAGVSNPAVGNVTPSSITASLAVGQVLHQTVSLTLPASGALTNMVDVFLLFDDTGSFTGNSPIVRAAFPQIISALQTNLPGIDLGFGVGRLEEYANFASEYATGRPFILNQPIVASTTPGFAAAIQSALDRTAPGYGGDQPETDIEALYQLVTGLGFDGNNNGSVLDSGAAGLVSTQLTPGSSGDVPSFASFTANGPVLAAAGSLGGAGFRAGALPIILTATDTGFAYQPKGETSVFGLNGVSLPISAFTQTSRPTTPFNAGAGIQETITGLNALGALVIGLGTNPQATVDPRQGLEAIARLTGAINQSTATIANGTADPIAPGDPFYFQISSGFGASVANGVINAIENAVTNVNVNITVKASDPRVHITSLPGVINNVGAGETATFDITFTGDGIPHRFDLQFVREGTNVVLGSIPVVLGTPIPGDGYEFEDLEEGEIEDSSDFGNHSGAVPVNVAPAFTGGPNQSVLEDAGAQVVANWATGISAGPASESGQLLDFIVSNDNSALFSVQPAIAADGTLTFTPAANANGSATITVQLHDNGGTFGGGVDTSAAKTFTINVTPVNDIPVITSSSAASVVENATAVMNVTATDIDTPASSLTFSVSGGADAAKFQIDSATGALSFKSGPDFDVPGDADGDNVYAVEVQVSDGIGTSAPHGIAVTVEGINDIAPQLAPIGDKSVTEGQTLTVNVSATDAEGDPVTLSVMGLPAFATFTDNGDGTGSIQIAPGFFDTGSYPITTKASDGELSDEETFALVVGNAAPIITLTGPTSLPESNGPVVAGYEVSLSHPTEQPVSVRVRIQDGSASVADQDFDALDEIVVFNPGDPLTKQVPVTIRGDSKFELNEEYQVLLESATNGTIGSGAVTTTIENDDSQPTVIVRDAVAAMEGSSGSFFDVFFAIELSNPSSLPIRVDFATADDTASTADGDYDGQTGSVTFAPGSTGPQTVALTVRGDGKFEQDQDFFLNLTGATNAAISDDQGRGVILNDDDRPTITVSDAASVAEGNMGTVSALFTITLSHASDETVTVNASTTDGTATVADGDYAAVNQLVTFAPGQTSQQVAVAINGDTLVEADESLTLQLSAAANATVAVGQASVTVVNDDTPSTLAVQDIAVNDGELQRSSIEKLTVTFSGDANILALISSGQIVDAIQVFNLSNGTMVPLGVSRYQYDSLRHSVRIDLTEDGPGGGDTTMLADGRYQLRLNTALITDAANSGNHLIDGDGSNDGVVRFDFHRLQADFDGDAKVGVLTDFVRFALHYASRAGTPRYDVMFDFNNDGRIDQKDFAVMRRRLGIVLPAVG